MRQYDTESCYNSETEKFDARKLKVDCPKCNRKFAALCSKKTVALGSSVQWVGCDYQESASKFKTKCKCGNEFEFATVTS